MSLQTKLNNLRQEIQSLSQAEADAKLVAFFDENVEELAELELPTLIANGDIRDYAHAQNVLLETGLDGAMIGRGIFVNPWAFNPEIVKAGPKEKMDLLLFHLKLWQKTWGTQKNYQALKKYFKIYVSGFDGAVQIRAKLMETKNIQEGIEAVLNFDNT
jgi:tRNA-dihydrouridine synthase